MVEPNIAPAPAPLFQQALADMGLVPKTNTPAAPAQVNTPTPVAVAAPPTLVEEMKAQREEQVTGAKAPEVKTELTPEVKPPAEAFDEGKYLSGKLGGKFKSFAEVETAYTDLEKKASTDPFVNPTIKGLNDYVKGGGNPDIYLALQKMDLKKMSEESVVVHQLMLEKDYSKEEAELLVRSKYKIGAGTEDEEGQVIAGVREAQLELKGAAHDARKFLEVYKADNSVSPAAKALEQSVKAFETVSPQIAASLVNFNVTVGEEQQAIPISEEARKDAMESVGEMIKSGTLDIDPGTPEGRAALISTATAIAKAYDFDNAIKTIVDTLKTKQIEEKHNTRKPTGDATAPPVTQDMDQVYYDLLSGKGRRTA